ncbi:MAG TPA: thioredoxin domain-containing protein [Candidatus Elarobacter sp.]|jgi:protein-disulfide isomerase|nr:thioredoxin domain-containing protein [Candidatus Elarobacter sp.]
MMEDDNLTRLAVPVGPDDHVRGPDDAPVTLVEYGDFECPYCGMVYPVVHELEQRYRGKLRLVFRSFPLRQHPHAQAAAEAAEFAADHGKFWEMHDTLYEHQKALDEPHLLGYARELGLDPNALVTALRERTYAPLVEEQKESGEESGIPGTPAFFLNGVLFEDDPTRENLAQAIDWLLEHGTAG